MILTRSIRCHHRELQPAEEGARWPGHLHDGRTAQILQRDEETRIEEAAEARAKAKGEEAQACS